MCGRDVVVAMESAERPVHAGVLFLSCIAFLRRLVNYLADVWLGQRA
jgi:hypothetical protein